LAPETSKYEQLQAAQVIDLNPGIRAGLFWTVPVTDDAVTVDLARGTATLHLVNVGVYDYTDLGNALVSTETGQPAMASLTVTWTAPRAPVTGGFVDASPADDDANLLHASHRAADTTIVFQGWHVADTARAGVGPTVPLAFRSGTVKTAVDSQSGPNDTRGQVTPNLNGPDPLGAAPAAYGVIGTEKNGSYFGT
jgi:hypothetical protein